MDIMHPFPHEHASAPGYAPVRSPAGSLIYSQDPSGAASCVRCSVVST